MNLKLCEPLELNLVLDSSVSKSINEFLRRVEDLSDGVRITYLRASLRVRDVVLDVLRFMGKASKAYYVMKLRMGGEIFRKLTEALINSKSLESSIEVMAVVTPLNSLAGTSLGSLYVAEGITPKGYALTLLKVENDSEYVLFDEARFSICALSKDFKVVGCIVPHTTEPPDLTRLKLLLDSLRNATNLSPKRGYITWLLRDDDLYVLGS